MNRNLMYQVEFKPTNPKEEVLSLPCLTTSLLVPNSSLIDENEWGNMNQCLIDRSVASLKYAFCGRFRECTAFRDGGFHGEHRPARHAERRRERNISLGARVGVEWGDSSHRLARTKVAQTKTWRPWGMRFAGVAALQKRSGIAPIAKSPAAARENITACSSSRGLLRRAT